MSLTIILASTSPRRQQLLELADIDFEILAVDIDESLMIDELPTVYIERMVANKTIAAASQLVVDAIDSEQTADLSPILTVGKKYLIITADTIGVLPDGKRILVKPTDKQDAFAMWTKMSGRTHYVWTAVQLSRVDSKGIIEQSRCLLEKTEVNFIKLSDEDMHDYWHTGEPCDKAGGYAIQGKGAAWVKSIHGSYTNVVGLPLAQTLDAIKTMRAEAYKK